MQHLIAQISWAQFKADVELKNNVVTSTGKVLKYMQGWSRGRVRDYCRQKGWRIKVMRQWDDQSA